MCLMWAFVQNNIMETLSLKQNIGLNKLQLNILDQDYSASLGGTVTERQELRGQTSNSYSH